MTIGMDSWSWKWTANGCHPSKSAYEAFFAGRTSCGWDHLVWKPWAPMRFNFFVWLVLRNRCWSSDRLAKRGLPHQPSCHLCNQCDETIQHLLLRCVYAREVWFGVLHWLGVGRLTPSSIDHILPWWSSWQQTIPPKMKKGINSVIICALRCIWLERNRRIFKNKSLLASQGPRHFA